MDELGTMRILKIATATVAAALGAVLISATAFATTATTTATATATAAPTASPKATSKATPVPVAAAGPLTITLTCDTGRSGSGAFTVIANGKSSGVSVKCGGSSVVSNAGWKAGSKAVIHQVSAAPGALRAFDVSLTLKATAQSVSIRNFKPAAAPAVQTTTQTATLAQTGGGLPLAPLGIALGGLLLLGMGTRLFVLKR